jgi:hypothetical protein
MCNTFLEAIGVFVVLNSKRNSAEQAVAHEANHAHAVVAKH